MPSTHEQLDSVKNKALDKLAQPTKVSKNTVYSDFSTKWLGLKIEHYSVLDSTQVLALKRAQEGCEAGRVVIADQQRSGKGQRLRNWHSNNDKGIWLSFVVHPNMSPAKVPQLTLITATVLAKVISDITGVRPAIKWPNDLLLGGKKVAGILTEAKTENGQTRFAVIGIGLNVNHLKEELADAIKDKATSLKLESNQSYSKRMVVQAILTEFEKSYEHYLNEGFNQVKKNWLQFVYRLGDTIDYKVNGEERQGVFLDIGADGCLIVENRQQQIEKLYSAEISWF